MPVKKIFTALILAAAFAVGGLAVANPSEAATAIRPSAQVMTNAPRVPTPHWVTQGTYNTPQACAVEGQYIVAHDPSMTSYRCLWGKDEDVYILQTLYDPL
jgi:hypothetical protein